MCGILFALLPIGNEELNNSSDSHEEEEILPKKGWNSLTDLIRHRGTDYFETVQCIDARGSCRLSFSASVLSLRGDHITPQPLIRRDADGVIQNILCWNGEIWRLRGRELSADENDGEAIFKELIQSSDRVQDVIRYIEGPFAFVFYDRTAERVWFGRDWLGRRSLLRREMRAPGDRSGLLLSSVSHDGDQEGWEEVEADGLYYIDLGNVRTSSVPYETLHIPFAKGSETGAENNITMMYPLSPLNKDISGSLEILSPTSSSVEKLYQLLLESLRLRVTKVPFRSADHSEVPLVPISQQQIPCKVGILFSGGLDCTVLARLVHELLPEDEPVELLNVAFENRRVIAAAKAQSTKRSNRRGNPSNTNANESAIGQEEEATYDNKQGPYEICPDRITGRSSFAELQRACPTRDWRFVEINVSYEEMLAHRAKVLSLIYPHDTEMDLSIGLAFYFAARPVPGAVSWPRILLSGLGADELFGGYARHGTAFHYRGFLGLAEELEKDLNRLGKRNLGRDDRAISHWGREARFPYLDEQLLQEVVTWKIDHKCGFGVPISTELKEPWANLGAEKSVLRLLAWRLGLKSAAAEKKRAIQFGSRTAKMEASKGGGKIKGTQKIQLSALAN